MQIKLTIENNNGRFDLLDSKNISQGELNFIVKNGHQMIINHTGVNPSLRGQGFAEKLVLEAIDYAKSNNLKILPFCSYVAAYFSKHPELNNLI